MVFAPFFGRGCLLLMINFFPFLGQFFEKYHAQLIGQPGGGGEYVVQDGFGWTNGVLLWMIKKYGDEIAIDPSECPPIGRPTNLNVKFLRVCLPQ